MEPGKDLAVQVLSSLGFDIQDVPIAQGLTADLLVSDAGSKYLIEVKDKLESEPQAAERRTVLSRGETYDQSDPLTYNNRISAILRKAHKQLDDTPKPPGTYQLIWFHSTGIDADAKFRQAFATFYGQVYVRAVRPPQPDTVGCFYFDYSVAFDMPKVEAVILTDNKSLQVCLNEFSHRADEFRESSLYKRFAELDGVVDPIEWVKRGLIICCRSTIPRRNDDEIVGALQEQTGVLYIPIRLTRYPTSVAVMPQH